MGRLEGKTALITGVDNAISVATAKQFVSEGAYVFITGKNDLELTAAIKEIGTGANGVRVDVSNISDLDRLFSHIERQVDRLDIVFPNASPAELVASSDEMAKDAASIVNDNVKGLFFTVQKSLPLVADGASIILNSSIRDDGEATNWLDSSIGAAVRSFGRTWKTELRNRGIRVNAVSSGCLDSFELSDRTRLKGSSDGRLRSSSNGVSTGRASTVDEIARNVVFLASDDSSDLTGMELTMNGGIAHLNALSDETQSGHVAKLDEVARNVVFLASDESSPITGIELFVNGCIAEL